MRIIIDEKETFSLCSFCDCTHLYRYARIEDAPGFLGCTQQNPSCDVFLTFHIYICLACGLIQSDAQATDVIYSEMHSEALGSIWALHHEKFAQFIQSSISHFLWDELTLCEIGTSAQPIARKLSGNIKKIFYIDPIHKPPFELKKNETYLSGFFPQVIPPTSVDLVIASHVLEHIPNAKNFMLSISQSLNLNGKVFISIPQCKAWFQAYYFNALSAEHVNYPFDEQIKHLAAFSGYTVQMEQHKEHSLFASFSCVEDRFLKQEVDKEIIRMSFSILDSWINAFNRMVSFPSQILSDLFKSKRSCFIVGASHLAQYFVLCNPFIQELLIGVLDNANKKWGQRLYGTHLKAASFDILKEHINPIVFLPPSPYAGEMKSQILRINALSEVLEIS